MRIKAMEDLAAAFCQLKHVLSYNIMETPCMHDQQLSNMQIHGKTSLLLMKENPNATDFSAWL